mgnify:CR=1 FL=1
MSIADAKSGAIVEILLRGDIDKFYYNLEYVILHSDIIDKICDSLFLAKQSSYAKYGIRTIFTRERRNVMMVIEKVHKIFPTKYDIIKFLLIDYYDQTELTQIYKSIDYMHKMNLKILTSIGCIWNEIPVIPVVNNVIYMCGMADIKNVFYTSDSRCLPVIKHMIYTRNVNINDIIKSLNTVKLSRLFELLKEPYDLKLMLIHNKNIQNIKKTTNYTNFYNIPMPYYDVTYLYECMADLIDYPTFIHLRKMKMHMYSMKFFERCFQSIGFQHIQDTDSLDWMLSGNTTDGEFLRLMQVLSKKCLTKYMEKFGAYESSDNLNERHLIDLILAFVK